MSSKEKYLQRLQGIKEDIANVRKAIKKNCYSNDEKDLLKNLLFGKTMFIMNYKIHSK